MRRKMTPTFLLRTSTMRGVSYSKKKAASSSWTSWSRRAMAGQAGLRIQHPCPASPLNHADAANGFCRGSGGSQAAPLGGARGQESGVDWWHLGLDTDSSVVVVRRVRASLSPRQAVDCGQAVAVDK